MGVHTVIVIICHSVLQLSEALTAIKKNFKPREDVEAELVNIYQFIYTELRSDSFS